MSKTWKSVEMRAARFFGAERNRCSGSSGRADLSKSDSTHYALFIEAKRRKSFMAALRQANEVKDLALKEGKLPVVWLQYSGCPWVMIRAKDIEKVASYARPL